MEQNTSHPWTILLNDGGMRSLVATAKFVNQYRLLGLFIHDGRAVDALSYDAMNKQMEHYNVPKFKELLIPHLNSPTTKEESQNPHPLRWQQLLVAAANIAVQFHAKQIIWPVQIGADVDQLSKVVESVLLLQQLIKLEVNRPIAIETPFLDFTDRQLVEVGHQMNVPWELSRSCQQKSNEFCGTCFPCRKRSQAFLAAGVKDPLLQTTHI